MTTTAALERARASFARRSWGSAFEGFATADASTPLDLDDLERLALAAYLCGRDDESAHAWTRAHHEAIRRDDPQRAARNAVMIGSGLMFRGEAAPALGWFARAGRVLDDCGDCPERAWLLIWKAFAQMWGGDPETAQLAFVEGTVAGERIQDADLLTMARLGDGMCFILRGEGSAGIALLDEVMVGVTSGEVSPMYAGIAYCTVIAGCSELFDVRRAREWTAALERWCEAQPDLVPFRGNCMVHRCELKQLEGAWTDAMAAARQACDYLAGPVTWDTLGSAYYQLGELQRLRGELAEAEESYRRASESGRRPEPGLALLRLAQGRHDAAAGILRRALDETREPPARFRLLAAYVETMIALGDVASARAGADELNEIAVALDAPYLHATAASAAGAVLLAEGDAVPALRTLRSAGSAWRELDAPYETARVQVLIGLACQALGDAETSALELDGARRVFQQLQAEPDIERLNVLARRPRGPASGGLTPRELEVLRLVASGMTNRAIARELGLSEKTVARHVSNTLVKIGAPSRAGATAYAYENRLIQP
ncbi:MULTISPECIES: helix-turn-helix transcriptional regulator [Nocardioides]|uniref:LuxR C-terminal-related transcriptional regulator n=1 Tax=Nocardioides vastitatis TaxID=2568655 RepID=A0ABW0ZGQ9_9ACTN|nr:helix-turn-helix transcriptional regulator [Nocardioides sp.]THJ10512.1 DNA-binding response regulator [Nocardioides sp.]